MIRLFFLISGRTAIQPTIFIHDAGVKSVQSSLAKFQYLLRCLNIWCKCGSTIEIFKTYAKKQDIEIMFSELKIRGGIENHSKIIVLFPNKNICCDPSLELSRRHGSNDESQNMFL